MVAHVYIKLKGGPAGRRSSIPSGHQVTAAHQRRTAAPRASLAWHPAGLMPSRADSFQQSAAYSAAAAKERRAVLVLSLLLVSLLVDRRPAGGLY